MPRIHNLNTSSVRELNHFLSIEAVFQSQLCGNKKALELAIEYLFLSGFKVWENFLEELFISHSRYNDIIYGKRTRPFLQPKSERHALDIIKLEKDYVDWTSPDNVVKRAEILFRNHSVITDPIKSNMQDLRDAKKIRNYIAHGGSETKRLFEDVAFRRIGRRPTGAGDFLNSTPLGQQNTHHQSVRFLSLINTMSQ